MLLSVVKRIDARALIGSAFLWAWVDALFMSSLFRVCPQSLAMAEPAAMGISLLGVPVCLFMLRRSEKTKQAMKSSRFQVISGGMGTAGSALVIVAGCMKSWSLFVVALLLCACFMSFAIASWGAFYCRGGAKTAMTYVAGSFGVAFFVNLLLLSMVPVASSVALSMLPLLASVCFVLVPVRERLYAQSEGNDEASQGLGNHSGELKTLGIAPVTLAGIALVMVGLGYMQHLVSFSGATNMSWGNGVVIQGVRGAVAVLLFVLVCVAPKRVYLVYRVGLLAIVAGFSLMPFLAGSESFWVSGAIIIGGYVVFDVFIWVIAAQAITVRKRDGLGVVLVLRQIVNGSCLALGAVLGIGLSKLVSPSAVQYPEAIFVGYLMTVAVMLLVGSRDTWDLFEAQPARATSRTLMDARLKELSGLWGLTSREREILALLAVGRTQPRIAENLGIAESTVNSHVRHIYTKASVNSKQELLDYVLVSEQESAADNEIA